LLLDFVELGDENDGDENQMLLPSSNGGCSINTMAYNYVAPFEEGS
jgi:hypothetical protein